MELDPIRVPCSSCGGKLVIRSEKLLGQSVACPRCKQPVRIPSNVNSSGVEAVPLDSQALTSVDLDASLPAAEEPKANLAVQALADSQQQTREFDGVEAALAAASAFHPEDGFDTRPKTQSLHEGIQLDPESISVPHPNQAWQSPSTQRRQLYLLSTLAVLICSISIVLLVLFLRTRSKDGTSIANAMEVLDNQSASTDLEKPAVVPSPAENAPEVTPNPNLGASTEGNPSEPKTESEASSDDASKALEALTNVKPEGNAESSEANQEPDANGGLNLADDDPLKILLKPRIDLTPAEPLPAQGADTNETPAEVSAELPEELRRFAPIFDLGSAATMPDARILSPRDVEGGEDAEKVPVGALYHPDPAPLPNWEELKHTTVPSLKIPNVNLLESLATLESVFGVPCDWDVRSMAYSRIDFDKVISKEFQDATVESIYLDLLSECGLTLNSQPNELPQIVLKAPVQDQVVDKYDLGQLVRDDANSEAWLTFLKKLFPDEAPHLQVNENHVEFTDDVSFTSRQSIVHVLDMLQAGKTESMSDAADTATPSLLSQDRSLSDVQGLLRKLGSETFARRQPVALMLTKRAQEFGLHLMVDWNECWKHGLVPNNSKVALSKNRTLNQISRFVLDEYALVIVVDPLGRLVVTTPEVQRSLVRYQLLELPNDGDLNALRQSLLAFTPINQDGRSGLQVIDVPGSESPRKIAVRISPPTLGQLATDALSTALGLNAAE